MLNPINTSTLGKIGEFRVIITDNLPSRRKYPTARKDGNKLGKKKKLQMVQDSIVDVGNKVIYCNETQYKLMENKWLRNISTE